jgi:sugar-specific transcriptional regulator TrmB
METHSSIIIMDLQEKLSEFLKEREDLKKAESEAHLRILQIDRTVKKLRNVIKDAEEILSDKTSAETLQDISGNVG